MNRLPQKGDMLIAINPCEMIPSKKNALIVGKEYEVEDTGVDCIYIRSEVGKRHSFAIGKDGKGWRTFFRPIATLFDVKEYLDKEGIKV